LQFHRLRLAGFKSFVDPVELEIAPGMTGVVGPNGCGKSNLVEALRWVMGETSARRMRGGEMEDVIFGGTATRPARNVAEVSLVIEDDGTLPLQFAKPSPKASGARSADEKGEVEVARKIVRGEGSDFRVNGRSARARDVQTLFADAASGAHSPALVSQGRVSALINAKPTERRQVLEDAAGVAGLHVRRHEAELKLAAAQTNLERLDDVFGTMDAQLASLKKQARQAIRYREISDDIRRAEAVLLALRWQALSARSVETRARFAEADEAVRQAMLEVTRATTRNTDAAAALPPLRREETSLVEAYSAALARRDTLAAEERQIAAAQAEIERQTAQIGADRTHEARQAAEADAVETRLVAEAAALARAAEAHPAARMAAEEHLAAARGAVARLDAELAEVTGQVAAAQAEAASLGRQRAELQQRLATLDRRLAEERRRLEAVPADRQDQAAIEAAGAAHGAAEKAAAAARAALASAETARFAAEGAIGQARAAERQASAEATRLDAERKALISVVRAATPGKFPPALDSIRVAEGYETALAVALGEAIEAALDPAAPIHWRLRDAASSPPLPAGAEPLAPHIDSPPALARALQAIGLVPDEATGETLAAGLAPGQILVTRGGAAWRWDGLVRRSGTASAAAIRLEQRNRLAQIERSFAEADGRAKATAKALAEADRTLAASASAEKQARGAVMSATASLERTRGELVQRQREAESRAVTRQALTRSLDAMDSDRSGIAASLTALEQAFASLPDASATRQRQDSLKALLAVERNTLSGCQATLERLGREESARNGRLASIAHERQEWRERATRAADRLAEFDRRRAALDDTRQRLAGEPERLAAARDEALNALDLAERARRRAADQVAVAEAAQQASERALRQCETALADAREARVRAEAAVESTLDEIEQLRLRAVERLGDAAPEKIDLGMLAGLARLAPDKLPTPEIAEARHARLIRDRDTMGPVNLRAELEVTELESEIERMTAERDDLLAAIARLRQAVHSLNKEARERLVASFGIIDAHFRRLFTQLFGGGAAELKLVDSEDPLEAGLEILASPPGKRLQQLSLLSGGEQALTAIALIFGMFLTNPSPVCVLDEVDAPLDDANVDRFCSLVQEIAEGVGTRFLIITHHRLTMARMDRLYGVTMAERGISQLVSVDLRQADELTAA
jgi:chromosome segregation protein